MRTLVAVFTVIALAACGRPAEVPAVPDARPAPRTEEVTLTLETRDGSGANGWSFAMHRLVAGEQADVRVASSDCGARGRWVTLNAGEGVELCTASGCQRSLPAGGSDGAFAGEFEVRRGEAVLGTARIARHSPTPQDWYARQPMPPFEVVLAF